MSTIDQPPTTATTTSPAPERRSISWEGFGLYGAVLLLWLVLFVVLSVTQDQFFSKANIENLLTGVSVLWIVALGMTFVVLTAGIDLSAGATVAIIGIFLAKLLNAGIPGGVVVPLCVVFGAAIGGGINGLLIGRFRLSFFVVTLGTLEAITGAVSLWSGTKTTYVNSAVVNALGINNIFGTPTAIWLMAATFVIALYVQRRTYFGRDVYAVGGNVEAARLSGIRVSRTLIAVYAIVGAAAGLAGVIQVGRIGAASPEVGTDLALQAAAGALLGGTSFLGGVGGVTGTAVGVLFIGTLQNGLGIIGVSSFWQEVVTGVILIAAVSIDRVRQTGSLLGRSGPAAADGEGGGTTTTSRRIAGISMPAALEGRAGVASMIGLVVVAAVVIAVGRPSGGTAPGTAGAAAHTSGPSSAGHLTPYTGPESKLPAAYPTPKKTGRPVTIGFANPTAQQESFAALTSALQKTLTPLGAKLVSKDDQLQVDKQTTDVGQLIAQRVDAIIVYPLDPKALGPVLKQAAAAHIPVVGLDVTADPADPLPKGYATQVLQGRDQQAYYQVQEMKQVDPGGKIGLINIGSPVPALKYLLTRERFYAKQAGLHVLGESDNQTDDVSGGTTAATGLLGKFPQMTGIIAYNDPSALGAVSAARTAGRQIKAIGLNGGSDGFQGVANGTLVGTVLSQNVKIGVQAAKAAYALATGQGAGLPKRILVPDAPVTSSTVKTVKTWDEQLAALPSGR